MLSYAASSLAQFRKVLLEKTDVPIPVVSKASSLPLPSLSTEAYYMLNEKAPSRLCVHTYKG